MEFLQNFFSNLFSSKETIYQANCGHTCKKKGEVTSFGETITTEIPITNGNTGYCHKCLEKMAIRCTWCGKPIFIGDQITLYSPKDQGFVPPSWAVIHKTGSSLIQFIGCQRSDCADSGADYCGRWIPPGKVVRYPSLIEIAITNPNSAVIKNGNKITILKTS